MLRLPLLSGKEINKILAKIGYHIVRQRGSHVRLSCSNRKSVTVPDYRLIGRGLLRKILRNAGLSPKEFNRLIKS